MLDSIMCPLCLCNWGGLMKSPKCGCAGHSGTSNKECVRREWASPEPQILGKAEDGMQSQAPTTAHLLKHALQLWVCQVTHLREQ